MLLLAAEKQECEVAKGAEASQLKAQTAEDAKWAGWYIFKQRTW
jgi:putative methionine-R-sulfoxide reductase with GAF domain